ncbi:hypothetical protein [Acetivibrio ethanolgignens]|uniref:hypothetical protein n=1 Tax=Acetivibrio ethanolgignens TaxID=290052 RepID=UPI001FA70FC8|nr:hypothetical protein [Acetivibrio ethanolgignens]
MVDEMKQHIIFECEICGKQSENREEIMKCEAAHLGMFCFEGMFEPHIKKFKFENARKF